MKKVLNDMNMVDTVVTVTATAIGSVVSAFFILQLQERNYRRKLLVALFREIKINHSIIQKFLQRREETPSEELTIFDIYPLYTSSYETIRLTNRLPSLDKQIVTTLEEAYELIKAHNRQISLEEIGILIPGRGPFLYDGDSLNRIHQIENKLQDLLNELWENQSD